MQPEKRLHIAEQYHQVNRCPYGKWLGDRHGDHCE